MGDVVPGQCRPADDWFGLYGARAVFFGCLVSTVRTLISVPAGIAGMPLPSVLAWPTLGPGLWTTMLARAGYLRQSQYDLVADYLNPMTTAVMVLIFS